MRWNKTCNNYQAAWDTVDGQTGEEEKTGYQIVLKRRRNGMKLPSSLKGSRILRRRRGIGNGDSQ